MGPSFSRGFWIVLGVAAIIAAGVGYAVFGWPAIVAVLTIAALIPVALFVIFIAAWMAGGSH